MITDVLLIRNDTNRVGLFLFRCFDNYIIMKISQATTALAALSQESRLRVFRLLVKAGPSGLPAGQIAAKLKIPAATLSFHVKELSNAGLIDSRKEGRSVIYFMDVRGIKGLMEFLLKDCCQGNPALCGDMNCCD